MHTQHLIALLQEGYTTIAVTFHSGAKQYTYKVPLTAGVRAGDFVVVDAPSGLTVVRVIEVHPEPMIDVEKPFGYKWIVQRVDLAPYEDQVAREAEAIRQLDQAERAAAKKKALEHLLVGPGARAKFLKSIAVK